LRSGVPGLKMGFDMRGLNKIQIALVIS